MDAKKINPIAEKILHAPDFCLGPGGKRLHTYDASKELNYYLVSRRIKLSRPAWDQAREDLYLNAWVKLTGYDVTVIRGSAAPVNVEDDFHALPYYQDIPEYYRNKSRRAIREIDLLAILTAVVLALGALYWITSRYLNL